MIQNVFLRKNLLQRLLINTHVGTLSLLIPSSPPEVASGHCMMTDCTSGYHAISNFSRVFFPMTAHPSGLCPCHSREGSTKINSDEQFSIRGSIVFKLHIRDGFFQSLQVIFVSHDEHYLMGSLVSFPEDDEGGSCRRICSGIKARLSKLKIIDEAALPD